MADSTIEKLLAEQVDYYRARAPEYLEDTLDLPGGTDLETALERFAPTGDVLELASGPGVWTPQLLRHADSVTAIDAAPEMLAIARDRVRDERVRFVQADLFEWRPDRRYDVVFFGFWLSHVPLERFSSFWALVDAALAPGGRVFFVDDAYRTPDELVEGAESSTIRRRLRDGSAHRAVKVAHTPLELERRLTPLGWDIEVSSSAGPFFWGAGTRAWALPGLIDQALAADPESDERREVVRRLQRRHDRETFDAALTLCGSEDPRRRVLGIDILAQLGYRANESDRPFRQPTITMLLELAETEDTVSVLSAIGTALGSLHDARAIDLLVRLAVHESEAVRFGAVEGLLGHDDDRAVDALVALSTDDAARVRDWATFGLGSLIRRDTPQVRDALMARLGDTDPDTRGEALVGLAERGDHRAIEPLLTELEEYEGKLLDEALDLLITHTGDQRLLDARAERS